MGPFDDFKAQELSEEKQNALFVKPKNVNKLYDCPTSFIVGERGSGKTTILRHLERTFNKNREYHKIAVYYRFETAYMKSLYNMRMEMDDNIRNFSQSISVILCKLLCQKLVDLKKTINFTKEKEICENLYRLMVEKCSERKKATFEVLGQTFEDIRTKILFNIVNQKNEIFLDFYTVFETFVDALREEFALKNISLYILLDEYENLAIFQQKVINSMVKASSEKVKYLICLRPEGFWTMDTVVEHEQIKDPGDYKSIDYVEDIMGSEVDIQEMMRQICHNSLLFYYEQENIKYKHEDLDIDNYLETQSRNEELSKISNVENYRKELIARIVEKSGEKTEHLLVNIPNIIDLQLMDILLEKKYTFNQIYNEYETKSKRYLNWKHNYEINAYYIILDECGVKRKYGGLDIMLKLANYNVRITLSILSDCFADYDFNQKKRLSVTAQDRAVREIARQEFEQIGYIPVYGYEIKNMTIGMGKLFRKYISDKQAKKFEVNHFSIRATGELGVEDIKKIGKILKNAVIWGVFIAKKANKNKKIWDYTYDDKDYILHPIYTVYFEISYRKKQKTEVQDVKFVKLFEPISDSQLSKIEKFLDKNTKNVKKNKNIPGQIAMNELR